MKLRRAHIKYLQGRKRGKRPEVEGNVEKYLDKLLNLFSSADADIVTQKYFGDGFELTKIFKNFLSPLSVPSPPSLSSIVPPEEVRSKCYKILSLTSINKDMLRCSGGLGKLVCWYAWFEEGPEAGRLVEEWSKIAHGGVGLKPGKGKGEASGDEKKRVRRGAGAHHQCTDIIRSTRSAKRQRHKSELYSPC